MGAFSELDDDALTITLQATSLLSLGRLKLTCIDGHKGPTIVCFGDGEFGELMGDGAFNDVVVIDPLAGCASRLEGVNGGRSKAHHTDAHGAVVRRSSRGPAARATIS
jgi:hypothetical protein